jgi:hypothetical protein
MDTLLAPKTMEETAVQTTRIAAPRMVKPFVILDIGGWRWWTVELMLTSRMLLHESQWIATSTLHDHTWENSQEDFLQKPRVFVINSVLSASIDQVLISQMPHKRR